MHTPLRMSQQAPPKPPTFGGNAHGTCHMRAKAQGTEATKRHFGPLANVQDIIALSQGSVLLSLLARAAGLAEHAAAWWSY